MKKSKFTGCTFTINQPPKLRESNTVGNEAWEKIKASTTIDEYRENGGSMPYFSKFFASGNITIIKPDGEKLEYESRPRLDEESKALKEKEIIAKIQEKVGKAQQKLKALGSSTALELNTNKVDYEQQPLSTDETFDTSDVENSVEPEQVSVVDESHIETARYESSEEQQETEEEPESSDSDVVDFEDVQAYLVDHSAEDAAQKFNLPIATVEALA